MMMISKAVVDLCPEAELILCCARTIMDPERGEQIKALLKSGIDWEDLQKLAEHHRMLPLLYWHLNRICPEAVPNHILAQFHNRSHANARRNMFLTSELLRLLKLFEVNDIPAIPYKGPVLAATVYGNLALRHCGDLDILVRKSDVPRARDLLTYSGYRLKTTMTATQEKAFLQYYYNYSLVSDDARCILELHWRFAGESFYFPLNLERLWKRLEPVSLAGTTVPNIPPEDLLLILCVHGAKHCSGVLRLKWLCDIAELIRVYPSLDWACSMKQAGKLGSKRMLFLGLRLVSELMGTALPGEVCQRIEADSIVKSFAARVCKRLFCMSDSTMGIFERETFYFKMRDDARYWLSLFRKIVGPSGSDLALIKLPRFLSLFYYLLRPVRLIGKHGPGLLMRFLKGIRSFPYY